MAIGLPLVLLVLFYLSFSVYSHRQNLLLSVYDFLVTSNSKLGRFAFFHVVFNFIVVIISLRSSKTSEADFEGFFSQTSLLYESNIQFSMKAIKELLFLLKIFSHSFNSPLVLSSLFCHLILVYSSHQNLLLSVYDFLVTLNSKLGRFAFFVVFNFIVVIISLGSSKTSEADFEGLFSQTSLLYESIFNTTTIDIDDKFQCSNNVDDNEHQGYDGSDEDINSDHIGSEEDNDDDENDTDDEYQGFDGSDEDINSDIKSDDIGSEEDDDDGENDTDKELEIKRVEEFIAKVKQTWIEELLTERLLLCI